MPRNGSGQFSAITNSWNPAINSVPATAADWQAVLNDIVSALTQSVSRDGQAAMTGNLPMAGNKVTGLGNATATGDALTFAQLFSQGQQQDVPAAATTDIGAQLSTLINVTGAATITSFGTNYNGPRFLRFAGVCTLINSATLVLPGGANITTAAGDSLIAVPLGNPATGWRVAGFMPAAAGYARLDGATFTGNVNVPSLNGGQLAGMRNKIINGKMEIAQRGTSGTSNNNYTVDRWILAHSGTAPTWVVGNGGDLAGQFFPRVFEVTGAAGNTATALVQRIEALNSADLRGKTVTFSAYVAHTGTGGARNITIATQRPNTADTWSSTTSIGNSGSISVPVDTWTRVTWTTTMPSPGPEFGLSFEIAFGVVTAGQLFVVTGVQLEVGSVATPFEHRPFGAELALCQRYYQDVTDRGFVLDSTSSGANVNNHLWPVRMRAAPTLGLTIPDGTGGTFVATATGFKQQGIHSVLVAVTTFTASAEL